VLEVNGAVDFTHDYSLNGQNIFDAVASMIGKVVREHTDGPAAGNRCSDRVARQWARSAGDGRVRAGHPGAHSRRLQQAQ
jgi:hypothetical protein